MNYNKIKTFHRVSAKKKSNYGRRAAILVISVVLIALVVGQVSALSNSSVPTQPTKTGATTQDAAKKKQAVKSPHKASNATPPVLPVVVATPEALVDPNHCEPNQYWRADNYECIDKPAPVANVIEVPAAPAQPIQLAQPAPQITAVSNPLPTGGTDCDLARSLIAQYDWNQESAYAVMYQESTCNSGATNAGDHHDTCDGSYGLFQISCENGVIYDAAANVAQAYAMYQARGWQPWGFTTCKIVACN